MSLGEGNLMGPISKNLVILGLATSLGALGIALPGPFGAADVALAKGGGGGGCHPGGGGGHPGGGHPGGGHPGGGHPGGSVAHYSGGHGHYSSHVSSHVSHGSGGHHYSTRYSGHTHTTGHTRTTNLSKTNLNKNKSNLSKSNVTDHSLKNAGQEKNLNSHVTPLKHDPKNFKERRDFANKTAFNSFWHQGWHNNWWHRNHFFHIGWIGPVFWPFAFGDFFFVALWPWDYWWYDPFWAYGYGDIYQ